MTNAMILISTLLILYYMTMMFPALLLMVFTSLNLFALLVCHLTDFDACNKSLTANSYNKGIGIINFGKFLFKFYRIHFELVSKYNTGYFCNKACRNLNYLVT